MKNILVLSYSQSGQLNSILQKIIEPMTITGEIHIDWKIITPVKEFPFPWPFQEFLNVFPESVTGSICPLEELHFDQEQYDLVILGYQVWYLSPSIPINSFLSSSKADVLSNTPVITVIGCRDMWYAAHEQMKELLEQCKAQLVGNIVFVDQGFKLATFITTPRWLIHGKKKGIKGLLPDAGVGRSAIESAIKYGYAIYFHLLQESLKNRDIFQGLEPCSIDEVNIEFESFAKRYFLRFANFIKKNDKQGFRRKLLVNLWFLSLIGLVLVSIPCIPFLKIKYYIRKKRP